jgi:ATP synthase regulation
MDFKKMFNSTTHVGRRNVSIATLGTIAAIITYKKLSPSPKVSAATLQEAASAANKV